MFATPLDLATGAVVIAGALVAGFLTGLAGFGTALVASGFWFYALPADRVALAPASPLLRTTSVGVFLKRSWRLRTFGRGLNSGPGKVSPWGQ